MGNEIRAGSTVSSIRLNGARSGRKYVNESASSSSLPDEKSSIVGAVAVTGLDVANWSPPKDRTDGRLLTGDPISDGFHGVEVRDADAVVMWFASFFNSSLSVVMTNM